MDIIDYSRCVNHSACWVLTGSLLWNIITQEYIQSGYSKEKLVNLAHNQRIKTEGILDVLDVSEIAYLIAIRLRLIEPHPDTEGWCRGWFDEGTTFP